MPGQAVYLNLVQPASTPITKQIVQAKLQGIFL
jgi:hypothetical protein